MNFIIKILIGFCVLLSLTGRAQNPLFYDNYYKNGDASRYNNNVILLNDSSYVFFNYIMDTATSRQDLGLFRIDKHGNVLQNNTFNYFNLGYYRPSTSFNNFIKISNSTSMAVGTTIVNNKWAFFLTKINSFTADTIKTYLFCDSVNFYGIGNLIQLHPNKYLAVGNKVNTTTSAVWPTIFELDSNINIVNTIDVSNPNNFNTFFANKFSNGKILIGGVKQIAAVNYPFLAEIDTLGSITKSVVMNGAFHGISQAFYNSTTNSYYTVGALRTSIYGNDNMYRICVTKLDTSLNIIWQKTYGKANYTTNVYDAVVNTDGSMVVVGRYSDSLNSPFMTANTNAVMLKINANGDSLWMREFDNINDTIHSFNTYLEVFFGIEKTPEGGYIMCGNTHQLPNAKAWVVKTDSMGCVLSNCSSTGLVSSSVDENSFSVYPNPANTVLNIEFSHPELVSGSQQMLNWKIGGANQVQHDVTIKITNAIGEIVQTITLKQQATEINISQLRSGLYFVNLVNQNGNITTKKVVVIR